MRTDSIHLYSSIIRVELKMCELTLVSCVDVQHYNHPKAVVRPRVVGSMASRAQSAGVHVQPETKFTSMYCKKDKIRGSK